MILAQLFRLRIFSFLFILIFVYKIDGIWHNKKKYSFHFDRKELLKFQMKSNKFTH